VSVRRELPVYATQGETARYVVEIGNLGRRALGECRLADRLRLRYPTREEFDAEIADAPEDNWFDRRVGFLRWQRLRQRLQGATPAIASIGELPSGAQSRAMLAIAPLRRGWLHFDAVRLLQAEPLGLCHAVLTLPLSDRLLSRPAVVAMPAFSLPVPSARSRASGQAQRRGDGLEFFALRDYRPGDPLKHIDWRTSARRGQPIVRQFAADTRQTPRILVDCAAARRGQTDYEAMVSVAASLLVAVQRSGPASLHLLGAELPPLATLGDALDALALLEPTSNDTVPAWREAFAAPTDLPVLLVCARWDAARAELIAAASTAHTLLVLCTDPQAPAAASLMRITQPAIELPSLTWPALPQARAS